VYNGTDYPAIATPDLTLVTVVPPAAVTPAPAVSAAAGNPATYSVFGTETWAGMTSTANIITANPADVTPAPPLLNQACDQTIQTNWGDPVHGPGHTCELYFPVIYAPGDLTLHDGKGQGLILVEKNLNIGSNFQWIGLILVHGYVTTSGTGSDVNGAVLAGGTGTIGGLTKSTFGGAFKLRKSTCATESAVRGGAMVSLAKHRSWADLY
jgi:peptidoglycan hydrolase-like protein with peptidoglycan-binding domain